MGWSYRKSFKVFPGFRINLSSRGVGASFGVKGARVTVSPGRNPQLSVGKGALRYTKTLSPSAAHSVSHQSIELAPMPEFALPQRGRYEANATIFQKRKLEQIAAERTDLTERFYEVIDSLGRDQADYVILYCETKAAHDYALAAVAARQAEDRREHKVAQIILWGAFLFILLPIALFILHSSQADHPIASVAAPVPTPATQSNSASPSVTIAPGPVATPPVTIPIPRQTAYRPTPAPSAFRVDVVASQRNAVMKHPDLGKAGSVMNTRFLARLKEWQLTHDPRLDRSNWPEVLANDCATRP